MQHRSVGCHLGLLILYVYWSSVPLPAQSLGPRYMAWKRATIKAAPKLTKMTREARNRLEAPASWPDAKLRALNVIAPPRLLSLPWVAPSLPWWPLDGGWKEAGGDPKLLMFSRFAADIDAAEARPGHGEPGRRVDGNALVRGGSRRVA
jgi:hypothetical protein